MLQGYFYTLTDRGTEGNLLKAVVALNASHEIFGGHFPGQPVVPGVCMMQIVKEVTEELTGKGLILKKADFLKFLSMINPLETNTVRIELKHTAAEDGTIKVDAQLLNDSTVYFKFKGTFTRN
jgi:3-hydroxyacyl-[acyl-carrier-protein] dehydratase